MARIRARVIHLASLILIFLLPGIVTAQDPATSTVGEPLKSDITAVVKKPAASVVPTEDELEQLFVLYRDAISARSYDEADTLAKNIVDVSIKSNGLESRTTAIALTNLAILQTKNEDPMSGIKNFVAAIDIVERMDNRLSSDLIIPLRELGTAQLEAGNADHARAAWMRAVHISHVNFGPHNMEQLEPLYDMARMYSRAGMNKEALKIRKQIYYLRTRETESWQQDRSPELER